MPHFGISNYKFKNALDTAKTYRITAWLGFKQEWRDGIGYDKPTPEEISVCRKLFEQLAQHPGLQIQISIDERLSGVENVKEFPRVARIPLYVGNVSKPEYQQQEAAVETSSGFEQAPPQPQPGKGFM